MKVDLTGQRFNCLTVVDRAEAKGGAVLWNCICDCGKATKATTNDLRSGHKKSCGCLKNRTHANDLTGQQFGLLTVKKRAGTLEKDRRATWECKCECGKKVVVRGVDLKSGNTKSCGCLHRNYAKMKHLLQEEWDD